MDDVVSWCPYSGSAITIWLWTHAEWKHILNQTGIVKFQRSYLQSMIITVAYINGHTLMANIALMCPDAS